MRPIRILAATAMAAALLIPSAVPAAAATSAQLVRISAEHHKGFDRVIFTFDADAPADVMLTWSDTAPMLDPSGLPSGVEGNAFLSVTFQGTTGIDGSTRSGTSYGRTDRAYDLPNVVEVKTLGDYEAVLSFAIGTMHRSTNVTVHELSSPTRVAIDIGTWFDRTTRTVWFADTGTFDGAAPYLVPVERVVPLGAAPLQSVAHRLFAGPTGWEMMKGLRLVKNGTTGFTKLTMDADAIVRIRLVGACYLVARPTTIGEELIETLSDLPRVDWVKVYDPSGATSEPSGASDSLPDCLIR